MRSFVVQHFSMNNFFFCQRPVLKLLFYLRSICLAEMFAVMFLSFYLFLADEKERNKFGIFFSLEFLRFVIFIIFCMFDLERMQIFSNFSFNCILFLLDWHSHVVAHCTSPDDVIFFFFCF